MRLKHKYHAQRCEDDGIKFASKKERNYYHKLKILQKSGNILFFLMQIPFRLPGGVIYRMDFMEFWSPIEGEPGDIIFTEVKGFTTEAAKIKMKQCQDIYKIHINVI
jgi:hypothetical protein